jgi:hypothetical protein
MLIERRRKMDSRRLGGFLEYFQAEDFLQDENAKEEEAAPRKLGIGVGWFEF